MYNNGAASMTDGARSDSRETECRQPNEALRIRVVNRDFDGDVLDVDVHHGGKTELHVERKLTAHLAVDEKSKAVTNKGHGKHDDIVPKRWQLSQQWAANDFDEIEKHVIVDNELSITGDEAVIPEYGRDKKRKLQEVSKNDFHITVSRAYERQECRHPI